MRGAVPTSILSVALLVTLAASTEAPGARREPTSTATASAGTSAQDGTHSGEVDVEAPSYATPDAPAKDVDTGLVDARLRDVVHRVQVGQPVSSEDAMLSRNGGQLRVRVEVVVDDGADLSAAVTSAGGQVVERIGTLALADVPVHTLRTLEARADVLFVRLPQPVDIPAGAPVAGPGSSVPRLDLVAQKAGGNGQDAVAQTGVGSWHGAGQTGQGVKVGIIDRFSGAVWNAAAGAGEVPSTVAGAICLDTGVNCGARFWDGDRHGVAVAEVITDMAPGAAIYLASATTAADLRATVDFFASQGVRIITRSETGLYDGPGNGTGPVADVIAYAESRGIAWFNSAGNSAGSGTRAGSYFRSAWSDTNGDGWMNFPNGSSYLAFNCNYINGLRWNDWGLNRTDYDIYLYEEQGGAPIASAINDQQGGYYPLENFVYPSTCTGNDTDYLAIYAAQVGNGTAGDILEFMVNGSGVAYWSNPYSVTQPAGDVATGGAAVIGAVDPVGGATIAPYSSQGPTNDGRTKPDLSAAAGVTSFSYVGTASGGRFTGTSAATPVVAGAAAVVLGANPTWTPAQLVAFIKSQVVDRGAAGADNVFGTGELLLAAPNVAPPGATVGKPGPVRRLTVRGSSRAVMRSVRWRAPAANGGAPITSYIVEVYDGKKRLLRRVVDDDRHRVALPRRKLHRGKNKVYVTAGNGTAYATWVGRAFRVRK